MLGPLRFQITRSAVRWVVWCLLFAVPLYGLSGSLVELLGSQHVHRSLVVASVAPASDNAQRRAAGELEDFRRLSSGHGHAEQAHSHDGFERHHHGSADATVIALDGGHGDASLSDEGGASTAPHVFVVTASAVFAMSPLPAFSWPAAQPTAVDPWIAGAMERPPRA